MMKLSNKAIGLLLLLTLVISVFGTFSAFNRLGGISDFFTFTGKWGIGTDTRAATNLTISSNLVVNFTDDTANFGTGYVAGGYGSCTIATDGTNSSGCIGFTIPNGLLLENQGNRYARINISNTNYTNSLLGGSKSGYAWNWDDPEDDDATCSGGTLDAIEETWTNITAVYDGTTDQLCAFFNYSDGEDLINISIKFHIDQTALARTVSDTILIEATDGGQ